MPIRPSSPAEMGNILTSIDEQGMKNPLLDQVYKIADLMQKNEDSQRTAMTGRVSTLAPYAFSSVLSPEERKGNVGALLKGDLESLTAGPKDTMAGVQFVSPEVAAVTGLQPGSLVPGATINEMIRRKTLLSMKFQEAKKATDDTLQQLERSAAAEVLALEKGLSSGAGMFDPTYQTKMEEAKATRDIYRTELENRTGFKRKPTGTPQPTGTSLQQKATEFLKSNGAKVTPANIQAIIDRGLVK